MTISDTANADARLPFAAESVLTFRLFGAPFVTLNGTLLPKIRSRKETLLLALLVLRAVDRPLERHWLAGTLWPETDESTSLFYLRRCLSDLRTALGPEAQRLSAPTQQTLRLDLTGTDCDVTRFDAAMRRRDTASLQAAVDLYRGPLLQGCTDDWATPAREARANDLLAALETLASQARQHGELAECAGYLRRLLEQAPLREAALRELMAVLAEQGSHAAAGAVYRAFRENLRRELNAEPSPETARLSLHIQTEGRKRATLPSRGRSFPAEAVLDVSHLPSPLSSLIGRESERDAVIARLESARLVTLTGTGGVGKTRLSIAVADAIRADYADGVHFIDLASLSDPTLLASTTHRVLASNGQQENSDETALLEFLRPRRLLLLLDNCEHLLVDCARFAQTLLRNCPYLRVFSTSREPFRVPSEVIFPLSGLDTDGATTLFAERASQVSHTFRMTPTIAEAARRICTRLDGIPLAIEMAAARTRGMSVSSIADRLEAVFNILNVPGPADAERHQTLRATLGWSYDLLTNFERKMLTRLSVFAGGCTLEAAHAVCGSGMFEEEETMDLLFGLIDKSLLVYLENEHGEGRYRLLETTRAYAAEMLDAEEHSDLLDRHATHYAAQANAMGDAQGAADEGIHVRRVAEEVANLRAALLWSRTPRNAHIGLRLAGSMYKICYMGGYITEGRQWLEATLSFENDAPEYVNVRTSALICAGNLALSQFDHVAGRQYFEEAIPLAQELGNVRYAATALLNLGRSCEMAGDAVAARNAIQNAAAIYRQDEAWQGFYKCQLQLGLMAHVEGDFERAGILYEEVLPYFQETGNHGLVAEIYVHQAGLLGEREFTDPENAPAIQAQEIELLGYSLKIFQEGNYKGGVAAVFEVLAGIASRQARFDRLVRLLAAANALRASVDGETLSDAEITEIAEYTERGRVALGDEAFAAAWATGSEMPLKQAVTFALQG